MHDTCDTHETPSRWERRKERTHRRLLEAADRMFRARGFDATTVEEIADAADVAKGTFFNYFESKAALLVALLYEQMAEAAENLPGAGQPAPERIRLTLEQMADILTPYRHLMPQLIGQALPPLPHEHTPPLQEALVALIREGQAQGFFREGVNVEVAAMFIATHFFRLTFVGCEADDAGWQASLEQGFDILYHGLLTQPRGE